jgi:excisionase family DNA binding protein
MPAAASSSTGDVKPPLTINEYAALVGASRTTVRKWIAQGRLAHERRGGGAKRAAAVLILTTKRPARVAPGSLTPDQRKAWRNKAKKA